MRRMPYTEWGVKGAGVGAFALSEFLCARRLVLVAFAGAGAAKDSILQKRYQMAALNQTLCLKAL